MFCPKCGSQLVPGARFCPKCGCEPGAAAGEGETASARTYTVSFTREKQWFAINPAVRLVVDDKDEYRIGNGETINVPMAAGEHGLVFKCGMRNKSIRLEVDRDLSLKLRWNRLTGSLVVR